ncbi:hypothetical protein [Streptomyces sp. CB01881]|uniref:hypothetical protein n=1 Tax=Streptomyces sp. CB01881 TaxID=2078691 RepID=UPI000CDCCBEF|nr:hypothetical protein [Streptomyces sp. CB01881]AUY52502.1 hypothetical protein C2142_30340 [Streptomyces sp. CB01881]TYC70221.1 hypothetical protein EH183_30380 [Streptomyces sp. CB01881]
MSVSVLTAVVFTVFAYVTTQAKVIRNGSPWQDDPYDAVVTFTMFFVPIIATLTVLRMLLCRRDEPLPLYRVVQLLRASCASAVLVTATLVTDWVAVILRADQELWDSGTPWLIAVLGLVSVLATADWLAQARARRLLPDQDSYQLHGDWLDDLVPVAALLAARLPGPARGFVAWLERIDVTGWIRTHVTQVMVAGSVFAGLMVATGLARENGFGLLFVGETIWFAGGMYAFGTVCDAVLQLTVRQPRGRLRQAVHIGVTAGAVALPVSLALRDGIVSTVGLTVDTPAALTVLTCVSAVLTGMVVFGGMAAWSYRR